MTATKGSGGFFEVMAWIFLLIVIAGFGVLQLIAPDQASPMRPALVLHAMLFLGWFALLIVQPRLVASRKLGLHMRIGKASIVLAVAMVLTGVLVIREAYLRPGWSIAGMTPQASTMFPVTDMIFFPLAYALAILNRRKPDAHKRYMLFSGMIMLDPALSRLVGGLGLFPPLIMIIELGLLVSVIVYDRKTLGRVHGATWFGAGIILLTYPIVFGLAQTSQWSTLVTSVLGAQAAPL